MTHPDPTSIIRLSTGYWDSQTLLTLAALKTWGYATAEIEDRMLTEANDDNTDTTP